ncbi:MAG TPA: GNAT family N-acetyltransferase [Candidatus Nitrosotenuis sp.]|nr:GNAT family N-acetyltransferase [Candidatus Nitrosotenuis sp.]
MIRVRPAGPEDVPFVRSLAAAAIVSGIPPTRDIRPEVVQQTVLRTYAHLDQDLQDPNFALLVAEREGALLGYIMLEMNALEPATGETQCYISDVATSPGRHRFAAFRRLMEAAMQLTADRGFRYLVGTVSVNNQTSLGLARHLGFQIERHQIVRDCSDRRR